MVEKGHQIGKMDKLIVIKEFIEEKNKINERERTSKIVKAVWAEMRVKSSSEDFEEKVYSINKRDYIIHYDDDIMTKLIQSLAVEDDGKLFYVTGFEPNYKGRQMFVVLNCDSRA